MTAAKSAAAWLSPDLMAFNLLPSRSLHPSRLPLFTEGLALAQLPASWQGHWHRHCSRLILERLGLVDRPVLDTSLPQLRLALVPSESLHDCARRVGAVLCGPRLRRAIAGAEVRSLLASVGEPLLQFVRNDGAALHKGLPETAGWSLEQTLASMEALGVAALMAAFHEAGEPLALRAELKLPLVEAMAAPLPGGQALDLATGLLDMAGES